MKNNLFNPGSKSEDFDPPPTKGSKFDAYDPHSNDMST